MDFIPKEHTIINENDKISLDEKDKLIEFNPKTITAFHPKTRKENVIELEKYNKFYFYATIEELGDKAYLRVVYDKNRMKLYELGA